MAELVIEGGTRLRGPLTPSGNKNAAFPLIAAALLTDQPVTLRNLPDISDVTVIRRVEQIDRGYEDIDAKLLALGARVKRIPT